MEKITSTLAREANGNIQITFSVPWPAIAKAKKEALAALAKDVEVPGFRKGKAPQDLAGKKISQNTLIEKTLSLLLPKALAEAIVEHKIKPAVYPRFELVSAKEGEAWQVRALTCELPQIDLGDYKQIALGALRTGAIWTPGKKEKPKELPKEEKEQAVIKALLDGVKIEIPQLLITEEADARIANLLARIEKLGLSLESYLASIGKTPESLRAEYEKQAKETIALDLILNKVAESEAIAVKEEEVTGMIQAAKADPSIKVEIDTPEQRRAIEAILKRRYALDKLVSQV